MAANPITFLEIEAYCRLHWTVLHPWEVETIKAVDQAVLAIASKRRTSKGKAEPEVTNEVDASDGGGVKAMFRGMGAKKGKG
jgi:hypothetical protein